MDAILSVGMRWLHFASIAVLLGGVFYARFAIGDLASAFKPALWVAMGGILISGTYNFLSKTAFPPHYHMWFGIKILLVLHIFAALVLYRGKTRALTGIVISGAIVIAISGWLRWISLA
jgi:hypothetical protein